MFLVISEYDITSERIPADSLTNKSIAALLVQKIVGVEYPIYFEQITPGSRDELSFDRALLPQTYLRNVKASPLLPCQPAHLMTKSNPVKYLLSRLALSGKISSMACLTWRIQYHCHRSQIRSQALSYLLPNSHLESIEHYMKTCS